MSDRQTLTSLKLENSRLRQTIEKLTQELSRELSDNVDHTSRLKSNERSIADLIGHQISLSGMSIAMENRYRVLAENVEEMITIIDTEGRYVYANQRIADFYNIDANMMIGKSFHDIMTSEIASKYTTDVFEPILLSRQPIVSSAVFNYAEKEVSIECRGNPVVDHNGALVAIINIVRDITDLKQHQVYAEIDHHINFIQVMSAGIKDVLENIFLNLCQLDYIDSGGIYILNEQTGNLELLVHYNLSHDFVNRMASFAPDTPEFILVAKGVANFDLISDRSQEIRDYLLSEGIASLAVIPLIKGNKLIGSLNLASSKPGSFYEPRNAFIENIALRITSIIGLHIIQENLNQTVQTLNQTITDLKIKQQILIQKSKMESLGEFSAGMAHEINQPLVIISLSVENIQQKLNAPIKELSPAYLKKKFETIQLNVTRIQQIIDNLRVFARDQSGILFEKVNVAKAVDNAIGMVSPRLKVEHITFSCKEIDRTIHVLGNLFKLEQVLLNLISNSVYAVNKRQEMYPDNTLNKQISIHVYRTGDQISIDLTDNGIGIPEENLEKIYTPFFTTRMDEGGTGLGLPIVYGIVKEMNGEIEFTSSVNEYTKVRLVIPGI